MNTRIENGITIISTGDSGNSVKNKLGYVGITQYGEQFRAEITIKRHKSTLGIFPTLEDAINARKVADIKKEDGSLDYLIKSKPHGNSDSFIEFWNAQFEQYGLK